jgi:CRISPR/Cas system-associated exonuclease Cas4 (RecB family)
MLEHQLAEETKTHAEGAPPRAEQFIHRHPEAVAASLRTVRTAVENSTVFEHCLSEATTQLFAEYELTHRVSTAGADLRVTGTIDLLYQTDGDWHIVDWKTGAQPAEPADVSTAHSRQLSVYAWLLKQRFDIEVDTATLVYIDPESTPTVLPIGLGADLDTEWVDQTIAAVSESMPITSEAGLETRPSSEACGSCPYARSVGGPCADDYYGTDASESQ